MLWVYLITSTLLLFSGVTARGKKDQVSKVIQAFFEARCLKNANEDVAEFAIGKLYTCFADQDRIPQEDDVFDFLCTKLFPTTYHCWKQFLHRIRNCLEPEEKYLPHFLLGNFNTSVKHHCQLGSAHITGWVIRLQSSKCSNAEVLPLNILNQCAPKLKFSQEFKDPSFLLQESVICSDLLTGKECVEGILKKECTEEAFTELLKDVVKPYLRWCSHHLFEHVVESV